jgi:hypothetical protein
MQKELLTIEFRYRDKPRGEWDSEHKTKTITIGVYDTLEEAVDAGNKTLQLLAKAFQVRADDRFKVKGLFGAPDRLVTNTCYPTKGIQYFAKIEKLVFEDLSAAIDDTFEAFKRYQAYKASQDED